LDYYRLITLLVGFLIVALASNQIAIVFQKIKFPLITGLIITGIIAGSSMLNFIERETLDDLNFLNDIALAIIAFSAGSELYLDDLRSRIKSIKWMVIGQLVITFLMSSALIYYAANFIPFMAKLPNATRFGISILFGTIFVARSPSSAIAVINEMRANGPFTKTVMGVTVVKDVLVIILFAVCFSLTKTLINGDSIGFSFLIILALELLFSFALGYIVGKLITLPFSFNLHPNIKATFILVLGYSIYLFADLVKIKSEAWFQHEIILEPLLIAIIGSFVLTNYSKHRIEFSELLHRISPIIYIIFFTLTGASLSFQTLVSVFGIALSLFFLRLISIFFGGVFGVFAANDNKKYALISWMPYLTQAGVALGLATIISHEFPTWGHEFETVVIAIIVINQLVGPPLFKWSLNFVKESHLKATPDSDTSRDAVIFGVENQSIALAHQLIKNKWEVKLVTSLESLVKKYPDLDIVCVKSLSKPDLSLLKLSQTEAAILMLDDTRNFELATLIFEEFGTKDIIVRLNERQNFEKFHSLGAKVIDPSTAIVSLLDHFVRSPNAASLLLGMDEGQDSLDIEVKNSDIAGLRLRDLRLPSDLIMLSLKRKGQLLITHGYTTLRIGDIVTLVGSHTSLEDIKNKFEN
jgi:Trk K+ transport system NAD-binding subunit/Kef-type K+ transport system membrane component KefB